jgi:hypothetical protein
MKISIQNMERYSLEKAQEEAEKMKNKVESGEAKDYAEASEQADKEQQKREIKIDGQKDKRTEIEDFQNTIEAETKKMVAATQSLQDFLKGFGELSEKAGPDISGLSAVQLKELFENSQKQAEEVRAANQILEPKVRDRLAELGDLKVDTNQGVDKLAAAIQEIAGLISMALTNAKQVSQLGKQTKDVLRSYESARVKEAGYDNIESFNEGYRDKYSQIGNLRRQTLGLGRWWNKSAIQRLRGEIKELDEIRNLSCNPYYYMYFFTDHSFTEKHNAEQLIEQAVNKLTGYYEELLKENPESQENQNKGNLLNAEELDNLNDQYMQEIILPRIEERKASYREFINRGYGEYLKDIAELEDPENIAKFSALLKRSYSEASNDLLYEEKWQDFRQQLESLPADLRNQIRTGYHPANNKFEELASYILEERPDSKQAIIKKSYEDVLKSLKSVSETAGKANIYLSSLSYDLSSRLKKLESPASGFNMEHFLVNFDEERWETFKTNPQMIARFGHESLKAADKKIGQEIKERILQLPEHTDQCIKLGYKLYNYKEAEYVPLAILNAYREPGYSGERPFLSRLERGGLYKYLASLSADELQKLKDMHVPGCDEIVSLILSNPDNFTGPSIKNQVTGEWEDNAVYQRIQKNLGKMAVHFLGQGDHKMDFYLMGLVGYLDADIGKGNELLSQILVHTKDEKTRSAALKCALTRIGNGDTGTVVTLAQFFDDLPGNIRRELRQKAGESIRGLVKHDTLDNKIIAGFGRILGRSPQEVGSLLAFLELLDEGHHFYDKISEDQLPIFFEAARNPAVSEFYRRFQEFGYTFDVGHMDFLPELIANQENLASDIVEIKRLFPEFRFIISSDYKWNADKGQSEIVYYPDVFDSLVKQMQFGDLFLKMAEAIEKEGSFRQEFSNGLLRSLRRSDILLQQTEAAWSEPSQKTYDLFYDGLQNIIRKSSTSGGKLQEYSGFFNDKHLLQFIARQPERISEVMKLPEAIPQLFALLKPGGPLYTNRESVLKNIFENGDAIRRAKEITAIFANKVPYWRQLYLFTESRIGDKLAAAESAYPITEISGVPLANVVHRHIQVKNENPAIVTTLESMIANPAVLETLISGKTDSAPLNCFSGMYKKLIFRDYLRRTIETSRSEQAKAFADKRNRLLAASPFAAVPDSYIHGSSIDTMDSVLLNGNLPQEALGESAGTDSYPFQVDFSKLKADYLEKQKSVPEIFDNSISKSYGASGSFGQNGQLFYIYDRTKSDWEQGKDYTTSPNGPHALVLGGMPSTEVTGIVLRNAETTLPKARQAILENGFYIPIYDIEGNLIMSPEEYDGERRDNNLSVPVEIWDYSLKTGNQMGSNIGGEFTVPEREGPVKYYVKFGKGTSNESLWNEQLADNLYRVAGLKIPETKVVRVESAFGHASRLLDGREPGNEEYRALLKSGFIMDCWLANWDIAAKTDNAIVDSESGLLSRIDNGGALLFRAQGGRKSNFGNAVVELESMRNSYPGLTSNDISGQISKLREIFTDEVIDRQVDGVRLGRVDRDFLKATLRERRNYIISYFEETRSADAEQLTDEGKEIPRLLEAGEIEDERLVSLIPEWSKLIGEEGYQHNGALLGGHIKEAISALRRLPEYQLLDSKERDLAILAVLFHDIAKPTGRKSEQVVRDFTHEIPSAQLAASYMQKWGYSRRDIRTVVQAILNDGVVSDIARGKIRDQAKNLAPEQLRSQLGDSRTVRILRALNRADVIATVGEHAFDAIAPVYNEYFEKI